VEATIEDKGQDVIIAIRMIGVSCFDAATNNELSREKAKAFALDALARHLGIKNALTVKGMTITEAHRQKNIYFLTVNIPKGGVTKAIPTHQDKKPTDKQTEKPDLGNMRGLFTVKEDYTDTVRSLSYVILADLPPKVADTKHDEVFFKSVADLEEIGEKGFSSLRKEIRTEKLLLQIEVEELLEVVDSEETGFLNRLKQHVDEFKASVKKE